MKLECPMLTSTEPCEEFRPTVTERFFIMYSNSRPSSRATGPDDPLTTAMLGGEEGRVEEVEEGGWLMVESGGGVKPPQKLHEF